MTQIVLQVFNKSPEGRHRGYTFFDSKGNKRKYFKYLKNLFYPFKLIKKLIHPSFTFEQLFIDIFKTYNFYFPYPFDSFKEFFDHFDRRDYYLRWDKTRRLHRRKCHTRAKNHKNRNQQTYQQTLQYKPLLKV